jgi:hypothetical protein
MGKLEEAAREFEQASFLQNTLESLDLPEEEVETIVH